MGTRKTKEQIIAKFQSVHGDRYDYSLVEYAGWGQKVKVVCHEHGVFEIAPGHHSNGVGCKRCHFDGRRMSREEFIKRSEKHFGNQYDYSLLCDDLMPKGKIEILCTKHQIVFKQEPRNHMRGSIGCPECKLDLQRTPLNEFLAKAHNTHGDRYDYSRFVYVSNKTKGEIICQKHGSFWQAPGNHIRGNGCPECGKHRTGTFKDECRKRGVNYWRALKRREAGLSEDEIFSKTLLNQKSENRAIIVSGKQYQSVSKAIEDLKPSSNEVTIRRWIREGMDPHEAFNRTANPGHAKGIIYLITHIESGFQYVGLTIQTLERRWYYHIDKANKAKQKLSEKSLHFAIKKYGADKFMIEIIDRGVTKKDLEAKERHWIKVLNTLAPAGYNLIPGGQSGGADGKPTLIDDIQFESVKQAAEYVAKTRNISRHAAEWRIRKNKIDIRTPSKPGSAITKTKAYKSWSWIVHGLVNPNSKSYDSTIELCDRWRDFYNFLEDVGQPPQPTMSFCRIDKNKGYFPGNCKWLSRSDAAKLSAKHQNKRTLGK